MQRIGLVVLPVFQVMCFDALSAFEVANRKADKNLYELHVLSESGGRVRSSLGMDVSTEPFDSGGFDTILVSAGMEIPAVSSSMIGLLRDASGSTRRLASICLGAFVLGEAGLLDGHRATTHWLFTDELQRRFPKSKVEMDRLFIGDGNIWTSAGMSAGVDLALGMIERDHGAELALAVAKGMVISHRRAGGQSQHSALLNLDAKADRIQTALAHAKRNLHLPLSVEDLARVACLSPRQFTRVFRSETGVSPAKAIESLRLEAAKQMLEQSRLPVDFVAKETGFGAGERMRRAFVRAYGEPPQAIRNNAGPLASI